MSEAITKIINQTLASGVEPLRRVYHGVFDGYEDLPVAYVTETEVFLTATGVIKNYEDAIEEKEVGRRWSISNIAAAHRALTTIRENGKKANFVTAFVTKSFLEGNVADDLAAFLPVLAEERDALLQRREAHDLLLRVRNARDDFSANGRDGNDRGADRSCGQHRKSDE